MAVLDIYIAAAAVGTAICKQIDGSLEVWPETVQLIENVQVLSGRPVVTSVMQYKWITGISLSELIGTVLQQV